MMLLTIATSEQSYPLVLPASEEQLDHAKRTLGIEEFAQARIANVEYIAPFLNQLIPADGITVDDANSRLNLLKPNAATRGWLTVFKSDFTAQERSGQPVAPLIVALARDGRNPRLAAERSNQIIL